MSFYNFIHGANLASFFVAPMLELGHPDTLPRFRDCFVILGGEQPEIHFYTRVGGGNRNAGFGEDKYYAHPDYLRTFDDEFDSTYGTYVFKVPEKWAPDFKLLCENRYTEVSEAYRQLVRDTFPKIAEFADNIFSGKVPVREESSITKHVKPWKQL